VISLASFIALRHRNFRLIWFGLMLSFTGSMMQNAALLWQVSLLVPADRKGIALGLVGLVKVVPIVFFSMLSGVVADAWDRRRLMLMTQIAATLVAVALAVLTFRGLTVVWPVYVLAAVGAAVGAFDLPARNALVPSLVPRQHLPNAISLNTIMFQTASVVGPSLGGLLITRDDVSLHAALEGLRFVFRSPLIRSTMLLDFFATFFSSATALLPIFAQDVLRVGAAGYGWLYAAPAAGAMIMSAIMVPMTERIRRRGSTLLWAVAGYGLATVVFGLSRSFWLTFGCLAMTGATDTVSMVIRNIVRQLETPDRLRGRMTGVNMVFFMGGPQLGELEAGAVANWLGAPFSVVSGGIGCILCTGWIAATTPDLRRYLRETPETTVAVP
jgi:MFS family permease